MYLLQFEFDEIKKAKKITDGDKKACDEGLLTIIDISDSNNPKEYYDGQWDQIENWED